MLLQITEFARRRNDRVVFSVQQLLRRVMLFRPCAASNIGAELPYERIVNRVVRSGYSWLHFDAAVLSANPQRLAFALRKKEAFEFKHADFAQRQCQRICARQRFRHGNVMPVTTETRLPMFHLINDFATTHVTTA